jgi:hypothetical protein
VASLRVRLTICATILLSSVVVPAKEKDKGGTGVDSGTFTVKKNGQRIATESFSVQDSANGKTISSQFKTAFGSDLNVQNSELRLSPGGDLLQYTWKEESPGRAELTVVPNDQFLLERITTNQSEKPAEQAFLMPTSTMVLDNNSFVQREVLTWKYLASACKEENGALKCSQAPVQFGVIVPQDRLSMSISLELVGREKVQINGSERDLLRLNLKDDAGQWFLWVDDQNSFKLMRIVIASENTEVVRY